MEIEKGAPSMGTGPTPTDETLTLRALAVAAFADKGEWYSIEQPNPETKNNTNLHHSMYAAVSRLTADISTKQGRVWIRFHKDSDGSA